MFKRTWKKIRILIIPIIILFCLPHSILPHRGDNQGNDDLTDYKKLNDSEQRLKEFKDNDEALKLKVEQLDIINKSRKKYGASPVRLDILASRVANKMSVEAAENEYLGHWNLAGEEPYLRYAFAGGYDHVSENAFGEWSSESYSRLSEVIGSLMKSGHEKFMDERAPYDGHKQTVIDKYHNFVGIGFCLAGKQFRYYEEFIDRYLEFDNIPEVVRAGEQFDITIKTNGGSFLYFVIIYREDFPKPLTPAQISKRGSYKDYTNEEYKSLFAWDLARYRNGFFYKIPLSFSKEGLYYIQIYSDKKELTKPGSLDTKGRTPESGIVIKVNR